ncbi:MAG: 16S rRNA (guanine(966)-N(2))-methyltransferase RsmD [Gammaproteobacteria bacterium]|nr:16S rRNA (guanine(966)-N(2))-methyltransferase RsmD [Gammaproteobacteria bacterium]
MTKDGKIRIISGQWKSRILRFPAIKDLRPTPGIIRETLFNWLREEIRGSTCLDLFAGSGALGFEAASRGAKQIVMVDNAVPVIKALTNNAQALAGHQIEIIKSDAITYIEKSEAQFDIVFVDPPYNSDNIIQICKTLHDRDLLNSGAYIYIESAKMPLASSLPIGWTVFREKKCGMVHSTLVRT